MDAKAFWKSCLENIGRFFLGLKVLKQLMTAIRAKRPPIGYQVTEIACLPGKLYLPARQ